MADETMSIRERGDLAADTARSTHEAEAHRTAAQYRLRSIKIVADGAVVKITCGPSNESYAPRELA